MILVVEALAAPFLVPRIAGSTGALGIAVGLLLLTNATLPPLLRREPHAVAAQLLNLVAAGMCAWVLLQSRAGQRSWIPVVILWLALAALFALVQARLESQGARLALLSIQVSLAMTVSLWLLVQPILPTLAGTGEDLGTVPGRTLSRLFAGILLLPVFTHLAVATRWQRTFSLGAVACIGQVGIGLMDLPGLGGPPWAFVAGLGVALWFLALAVWIVLPRRWTAGRNPS